MSVIQQIRDKAAWAIFVLIALSLVGFLLMDAFVGKSSYLSRDTEVGVINGEDIDIRDFEKRIKESEEQYQAQGMQVNEQVRQSLQEQVWNGLVDEKVLTAQLEKLGIGVGTAELNDLLYGADAPADFKQQFTDPKTGVFDVNAAKQALAQLKKATNNPMANQFFNQYLPALMKQREGEKYYSLMGNSLNIPKWMVEKMNGDNNQIARLSFVALPYTSISDSAVKVSDADLQSYIDKHKDDFKVEPSRSIAYVSFSAAPTLLDSNNTLNSVVALKEGFMASTDGGSYVTQQGTAIPYYDAYVAGSKMQVPNADAIKALADGQVFGPYLDNNNFVLAKMIGRRSVPDSAKCRHILISTQDGTADAAAKKRADSIAAAVAGGSDFKALAAQFSADPGSKDNGGEYTFGGAQFGNLAKEFAEAVFYGNTGDKKVIKTQFGYHYIEVLSQKNPELGYKVAYLAKEILPSGETESTAMTAATQFASEVKNKEQFEKSADAKKLQRFAATDIAALDANIGGLGASRALVRWAFDNKVGTVSEPFNIGDRYVVALVTDATEKGTMSVAKARPMIETIVRNQKKAKQLIEKIGKPASLDVVANANKTVIVTADSLSFSSTFVPNLGTEGRVVGAAFNKSNLNKVSAPIEGNSGVFVIRTDAVAAVPNLAGDVNTQRQAMINNLRGSAMYRSMEGLRKSADVEDKRAKFY